MQANDMRQPDLERLRLAGALMTGFAESSGLSRASRPERYLWTDAFAVCNFLGIHRRTGKAEFLEFALRLVDQVHHVLGRHRDDEVRRGWISGLAEADGERHPTRGGLRIGKPLPERRVGVPLDPDTEWDRDGQYLHYLTQWMHALHRVAQDTGNLVFDDWAVELARAAHAAFATVRSPAGIAHLAWKMSIDLRRVLVPSMGQHDAIDMLACCLELQADRPVLEREIAEVQSLAEAGQFETGDALGVGGLLISACRLASLAEREQFVGEVFLQSLFHAARRSLDTLARADFGSGPAESRLAFRELGLAIGLQAPARLHEKSLSCVWLRDALDAMEKYTYLVARIESFWSEAAHRRNRSWTRHRQINDVMLATCLQPDGYLGR
jgi:hypothetical protein